MTLLIGTPHPLPFLLFDQLFQKIVMLHFCRCFLTVMTLEANITIGLPLVCSDQAPLAISLN